MMTTGSVFGIKRPQPLVDEIPPPAVETVTVQATTATPQVENTTVDMTPVKADKQKKS